MHKQQRPKEVSEMSASELVGHWQAEVDRLLDVRCGFRIANTNMDSGRKWTSNEAAQYSMYREWANVNGWPTEAMKTWDREFDAAEEQIAAAKLNLQKRTGNETTVSSRAAAVSNGNPRCEAPSVSGTSPDLEVETDARSGNDGSSAVSPAWSSRVLESMKTFLKGMEKTPRTVEDDSIGR